MELPAIFSVPKGSDAMVLVAPGEGNSASVGAGTGFFDTLALLIGSGSAKSQPVPVPVACPNESGEDLPAEGESGDAAMGVIALDSFAATDLGGRVSAGLVKDVQVFLSETSTTAITMSDAEAVHPGFAPVQFEPVRVDRPAVQVGFHMTERWSPELPPRPAKEKSGPAGGALLVTRPPVEKDARDQNFSSDGAKAQAADMEPAARRSVTPAPDPRELTKNIQNNVPIPPADARAGLPADRPVASPVALSSVPMAAKQGLAEEAMPMRASGKAIAEVVESEEKGEKADRATVALPVEVRRAEGVNRQVVPASLQSAAVSSEAIRTVKPRDPEAAIPPGLSVAIEAKAELSVPALSAIVERDPPAGPASQRPHTPLLAQHVAQQMAVTLRHGSDRVTEMALDPAELGKVRMTVKAQDQAIVLTVVAERLDTADLMRRHTDVLQQEFRALGYTSVTLEFSAGQGGAHHGTARADRPAGTNADAVDGDPRQNDDEMPDRPVDAADGRLDLRI